ncbi:MAG: molecular chaperone DnaJ [Actinomycetia bacterium]|nr:molecular chaperone DnaJ [Actinomycetes bacterium]
MNGKEIKDYYKTLGVSDEAARDEIKKAYRKLAKKHHPDINPSEEAEEKMKEINEAYEVLGNEKKKQEYDQLRKFSKAGFQGFGFDFSNGGGVGQSFTDIFDLFTGSDRSGRKRPRRGSDLTAVLKISFDDSLKGVVTKIPVNREVVCEKCKGTGAKPGTFPENCMQCQGRGVVAISQGVFSLSRTCPQCGGEGKINKNPCKDCRGRGRKIETTRVSVKIPAGIDDGARIRVVGMGESGTNAGPSGDLYIIVSVLPHPYFQKEGPNIYLDIPITYTEAALGGRIKVPTVNGKVTLKIPQGTQNAQIFRLKGKGAHKIRGIGKGDMLVKVHIIVPKKLSKKEKEILRKLSELSKESPRKDWDKG